MATFVHGIGASENIDSSGEIISLAGLDISSLDKDGVLNWEHKSDQPSQIVGKILKAKKIFSDKDCEDDHQMYFWQKVQVPYLYVMGELFDDYKDSAREVAGLFRYDADKKGQNERSVANFSVEGAKISKEGMTITRSIARKITITALPCNKAAVAEMVSVAQPKAKKSDIDSLFKTEDVEIEVLQVDNTSTLLDLLKKEDSDRIADKLGIKKGDGSPMSAGGLLASEEESMKKALHVAKPPGQHGTKIGATSSGKDVHSHGMIAHYGFNSAEHKEASNMHRQAAKNTKDPKAFQHHTNKFRLHEAAAHTMDRKKMKASVDQSNKRPSSKPATSFNKADTAGSVLAAPDKLVKGGAYSGNVPKDKKVKELQEKIDAGTYKPDSKKTAEAMITHKNQPLKKAAEKGVHIAPDAKKPGNSYAGNITRNAQTRQSAKDLMPGVKAGHKAVLNTLKQMPKPNLTKSNEKGVHEAYKQSIGTGSPGTSVAGMSSRTPAGRAKNKEIHQQKLGELKAMPKPNLTKEEMEKSVETAATRYKRSADAAERIKGVHKPVNSKDAAGRSSAGVWGTKGNQPHQKENAKNWHKEKLGELKAMPKPNLTKSKWLARAEDEYAQWDKREEFETFMKSRMPHLTKSEIKAIGQTMLLQKSLKQEQSLAKIAPSEFQHSFVIKKENK